MKLSALKFEWLRLFTAMALAVGAVVAARAYLELERQADAAQAFAGTLERIFHDQQLSMALEQIRQGEAAAAAQRLDLLLCGDVVRSDLEMAAADALTRAAVQDSFRRIALIRPKPAARATAGSAAELADHQFEAERILNLALGAAVHAARAK